jgi:hypothetical protein
MWAQTAGDLSSGEVKQLESLVVDEIQKQRDVKIVELSYSEDFIGVVVVAAKLPSRKRGTWYYVASSVLTVARKDGTDELVTHDVIAGDNLDSVSRTVGLQFASARFRAAAGPLEVTFAGKTVRSTPLRCSAAQGRLRATVSSYGFGGGSSRSQ